MEKTLSIIKPDAVERNLIGKIITCFENKNLKIIAQKMIHMSEEQASGFYAEHKERSFFPELVEYISSGPVVVMILQGENAIALNREIMGATNPKEAAEGTIRNLYALSIGSNSVHGSDSAASAEREIAYFFKNNEIF